MTAEDDTKQKTTRTKKPAAGKPIRAPAAVPEAAKRPRAANPKASEPSSTEPSLHPGAVDALLRAEHADPFAVLGPHAAGDGVWDVRVFVPGAHRVEIVHADASTPARRVHDAGIFVGRIESKDRPDYRLEIEAGGHVWRGDDAYRFGGFLDEGDVRALRDVGSDAIYRKLGAHRIERDGIAGYLFAVWAPNARRVSVVGDFNQWDGRRHPMRLRHDGGVWELLIPDLAAGSRYKYEVNGADGRLVLKSDPVAFATEQPPATASILSGLPAPAEPNPAWLDQRNAGDARRKPISIYECHLGSWARVPEEGDRYLTYRELGERLIPYVKELGFTHIELLPITEYPFDGSWGYQTVSMFAPTSRFGTPDDFKAFVATAHAAGIGILLDWVPGHFPNDPHGLALFDGTHLYEHADPRQGFHQDWGTYIYNFGRDEVQAFLVASARFWLEHYGLDGLRVDAVASMLYLDYSRKHGEWVPNRYGGNENLDAIQFMRRMNEVSYGTAPGAMTIAEESTAWPAVSHPTYTGGLGFGFKWNMGWMHDTLRFISKETVHRRWHHHDLTFGLLYAFTENFVLPLSHDEVVHGKGSLLNKMPGDRWQKFANLRAYLAFMWGHPGKKLIFMGGEFGQEREWNHDTSLDWHLLRDTSHAGLQALVRDLNAAYREVPALHERDCDAAGFSWIVSDDSENSVIAWLRRGESDGSLAIVVSNFTPIPREGYRIGVPRGGVWRERINSDAAGYGGSNLGNMGGVLAEEAESHDLPCSLTLTLPPLATLIFTLEA